jgi:hypothetical protein
MTTNSLFLFVTISILMKIEQSERIYVDYVSLIFIVFTRVSVFAIESQETKDCVTYMDSFHKKWRMYIQCVIVNFSL